MGQVGLFAYFEKLAYMSRFRALQPLVAQGIEIVHRQRVVFLYSEYRNPGVLRDIYKFFDVIKTGTHLSVHQCYVWLKQGSM